jgi:hypothetical protein
MMPEAAALLKRVYTLGFATRPSRPCCGRNGSPSFAVPFLLEEVAK